MFVADVKCSQATWQTVPNSQTRSAKPSVTEVVVRTWHRTHVIRERPKGSSVAFGDEMDVISQERRYLTAQCLAHQTGEFELHSRPNRKPVQLTSTGVMWSRRLAPVMRRFAAFCSDWTLLMTVICMLANRPWVRVRFGTYFFTIFSSYAKFNSKYSLFTYIRGLWIIGTQFIVTVAIVIRPILMRNKRTLPKPVTEWNNQIRCVFYVATHFGDDERRRQTASQT